MAGTDPERGPFRRAKSDPPQMRNCDLDLGLHLLNVIDRTCRLDMHHIFKKHRMTFYYWRLAHSTSNFLQDILRCYFGEHFSLWCRTRSLVEWQIQILKRHSRTIFAFYVLEFIFIWCLICFISSAFGGNKVLEWLIADVNQCAREPASNRPKRRLITSLLTSASLCGSQSQCNP